MSEHRLRDEFRNDERGPQMEAERWDQRGTDGAHLSVRKASISLRNMDRKMESSSEKPLTRG